MRKFISFLAISTIFSASLMAQENPFKNSTWKITKSGEKTILTKTGKINPVTAQPKFHYIDFSKPGKMSTGTNCYSMNGYYSISENTVEFSEGTAGMSSDCEEPENLNGYYHFLVKANTIVLEQIDAAPSEEGEEAEGAQAAVGAEVSSEAMDASETAVEVAADAAEAASNPKRNQGKKPVKKGGKK